MNPRFQGTQQLLGNEHFNRIREAHVLVVGLGGVGSWVVEGLARSGVGALTLVDGDEVCITNVNRQIQALDSEIGRQKVTCLAERVRTLNPECVVRERSEFFTRKTAAQIFDRPFTVVVDAIDSVESKRDLIALCVERGDAVVTVGSAGDRKDPSTIIVDDLASTIHDPLLQCIRKQLRQHFGFPKGARARFGIPCVYAPLQRGDWRAERSCEVGANGRKTCNDGLGSAVYITATMGFFAVAEVVKIITQERQDCYAWRRHLADRAALLLP
jgi:tRNA A37 threonylcarbamoyladenosine dehydratase